MKNLSIGAVRNLEDAERALRDVETHLTALFPDDPPASSVNVPVVNSDGVFENWSVVSGGGCTVTLDAALKQIRISVP